MRVLIIAIFASLALGACKKDRKALTPAEAGLVALVARTDMHGKALAKRHDGPTLVAVFASWCEPCREELGVVNMLRERHPTLRVIGLNAYENFDNLSSEKKLVSFLQESAPWLTVVRDKDKSLIAQFGGVPKIPTSFVFDSSGRVVAEFRRDQRDIPSEGELEAAIELATSP